jgi:hypothetical protein
MYAPVILAVLLLMVRIVNRNRLQGVVCCCFSLLLLPWQRAVPPHPYRLLTGQGVGLDTLEEWEDENYVAWSVFEWLFCAFGIALFVQGVFVILCKQPELLRCRVAIFMILSSVAILLRDLGLFGTTLY